MKKLTRLLILMSFSSLFTLLFFPTPSSSCQPNYLLRLLFLRFYERKLEVWNEKKIGRLGTLQGRISHLSWIFLCPFSRNNVAHFSQFHFGLYRPICRIRLHFHHMFWSYKDNQCSGRGIYRIKIWDYSHSESGRSFPRLIKTYNKLYKLWWSEENEICFTLPGFIT